jgi:PcfJ-like protein
MNPNPQRMPQGIRARSAARAELVESRLRRYPPVFRNHVRALASRHARLADLALSFPGLLFALAAPRPGFCPAPTIARVIDGAPLAELAAAARLPLWLRKLPPETFAHRLDRLPDGELFRRRIANHLPGGPKHAADWLTAVADAAAWDDELLAVWIAREVVRNRKRLYLRALRLIALFAWFSRHPGTRGHHLIERPWNPDMHFDTAHACARAWAVAVSVHLNFGDRPLEDVWLEPGSVGGYEFMPVRSIQDLLQEGATMRNCVATYGANLAFNRSRIWSVRREGQRVATLKVSVDHPDDPLLHVSELRASGNRDVPAEVWWAARRWLHMHDLLRVDTKRRKGGDAPLCRITWILLWRPYWLAKRHIPDWLPLAPSRRALRGL